MWAMARYDLRLSEAEAWALDLHQFGLLMARRQFDFQMQQWAVAAFGAAYINGHKDKDAEPVTTNAFLAFPLAESPQARADREKAEELKRLFEQRMLMKRLKAKAEKKNGVR